MRIIKEYTKKTVNNMSGGEIPMTMAIADITQLVMGKPTLVQI